MSLRRLVSLTLAANYEMKGGYRQLIAEVGSNAFEYETPVKYDPPWREFYAITTVTSEGESLGAAISVR